MHAYNFLASSKKNTEVGTATKWVYIYVSVELCPRSCPPEEAPEDFIFAVNRPFVFYITQKFLVLFTGRISSL